MSAATQTCQRCGDSEAVVPDGRGFPPDIAKRRLVKRCKARGCKSEPKYTPGFLVGPPPHGMTPAPPSTGTQGPDGET